MGLQLRFNICELLSSFLLDLEVGGLEDLVSKNINEPLQYSCQHWGKHLVHATNADSDLISTLRGFLDNKLLFWIEVMNLIGSRSACDSLLRDTLLWIGKVCSTSCVQLALTDVDNGAGKQPGSPEVYGGGMQIHYILCWQPGGPVNPALVYIVVDDMVIEITNINEMEATIFTSSFLLPHAGCRGSANVYFHFK
jgi:hypothetical protein